MAFVRRHGWLLAIVAAYVLFAWYEGDFYPFAQGTFSLTTFSAS